MSFTFGQKAVGYNSNPSPQAIEEMERIRSQYAKMIDDIHAKHIAPGPDMRNGEVVAMAKLSIRHLQEASYWLIKTVTWSE